MSIAAFVIAALTVIDAVYTRGKPGGREWTSALIVVAGLAALVALAVLA